jgi:hypothetical protein
MAEVFFKQLSSHEAISARVKVGESVRHLKDEAKQHVERLVSQIG